VDPTVCPEFALSHLFRFAEPLLNFLAHILTSLIPALTTTSFDLTGKRRIAQFAQHFNDAAMVLDVDMAALYGVANFDFYRSSNMSIDKFFTLRRCLCN